MQLKPYRFIPAKRFLHTCDCKLKKTNDLAKSSSTPSKHYFPKLFRNIYLPHSQGINISATCIHSSVSKYQWEQLSKEHKETLGTNCNIDL